MKGRY